MESVIIGLVTTLAQNPQVQAIIANEINKVIPGNLGGILSEVLGLFKQTTAPTPGTVTVRSGPSQTVKNIQNALNVAGIAKPPLTVDGYLGPKTEAALKAAGTKFGIPL